MNLGTAYQVRDMVVEHQDACTELGLVMSLENTIKSHTYEYGSEFELKYRDHDGDTMELFTLKEEEVPLLFDFLRDICNRRKKNIEHDLDRLLPEVPIETCQVLRIQYKDLNFGLGQPNKLASDVTLHDIAYTMSTKEVQEADEIWLIDGDNSYALKCKLRHEGRFDNRVISVTYAEYAIHKEGVGLKPFDEVLQTDLPLTDEQRHNATAIWFKDEHHPAKRLK